MRWFLMAPHAKRSGYTLIEMLMSVVLTLMMMGVVVQIFAMMGRSVSDSRSTLEMSSQLRSATARLRLDLQNVTAEMTPPLAPEQNQGYFEYIEGPVGPVIPLDPTAVMDDGDVTAAWNIDQLDNNDDPVPDSTVGDTDDILMFTVRSPNEPFVGRAFIKDNGSSFADNGGPFAVQRSMQSSIAEVAWFVRGRTLYRRTLLVRPNIDTDLRSASPGIQQFPYNQFHYFPPPGGLNDGFYGNYFQTDHRSKGFYNNFDLSVRLEMPDPADSSTWRFVPNTLADLTKRENRFAHMPCDMGNQNFNLRFPFGPQIYFDATATPQISNWRLLGLPTLRECSHWRWIAGLMPMEGQGGSAIDIALNIPAGEYFDAWANPYPFDAANIDQQTGTLLVASDPPQNDPNDLPPRFLGPRVAEDVILNNVIGFDVKAWDPGAPLLQMTANGPVVAPGDPAYPSQATGYTPATLASVLTNTTQIVGRGAYVDLNYAWLEPSDIGLTEGFCGRPELKSGMRANTGNINVDILNDLLVYDTWSTHYEHDGIPQLGNYTDGGTNGLDDNNDGVVDDPDERDTMPPYSAPLRGIQIKVRVFEPDSRQIREVTIIQDFLAQ